MNFRLDLGQTRSRWHTVREFLFGMFAKDIVEHVMEMRSSLESLFLLVTIGDIIGIPVLPPYYSLRLLPYLVPNIAAWKRRVVREREFTDEHDYHLEGL
jgi:hypothetical protein